MGDITAGEVLTMYNHRRLLRGPILEMQTQVRDLYNNDKVVPIADMDRTERPAVPNLLKQGVNQQAARIASTVPTLFCPPRSNKKREQDASQTRRKALLGWWEMNHLFDLLTPVRARHLVAYSCAPTTIGWDRKRGIPTWNLRDPLACFPTPSADVASIAPDDVIFLYQKTRAWVQANYPEQAGRLFAHRKVRPDDKVTILEFENAEWCMVIAATDLNPGSRTPTIGTFHEVLEKYPNRTGMCRAVVPNLFSLDRPAGQFDGIIPMYAMQAELMALAVIAAQKGVFPDLAMIGTNGQEPRLVGDKWYDGRTGRINTIIDGELKEIQTAPGYQTAPMIDRIERSAHVEASIPAEWGGESTTGIRTGRRGDAVLSAAVDYMLQEAQRIIAAATQEENKRAIAVMKAYSPDAPTSFYVNWRGTNENIEYVPRELFTTDENLVQYAHAGSDLQQVTVMTGQLLGLEVVSKEWARENLPVIDDPEQEKDRIIAEKMVDALLASIYQKMQTGEIAPVDGAWLIQQIKLNKMEPEDAIIALDERVQKRQASQVPPEDPMAQAGLATGTPAEAQMPGSIPQPSDALSASASLMNRLRQVSRPVGQAV